MADFAALAKRLIDANGRSIIVVKNGDTPQDADQPWRGQADYPVATVTGIGAFVPASMVKQDSGVKRGVNYVLFPASDDGGNRLEFFDEIVDGEERWKILNTEVLEPADIRFLYIFEVAR